MPRPDEAEFLNNVLQGNQPAILFCQQLFQISQVLDDLVDGDKPIQKSDVIKTFWQALIELPANPFYRQHEPYLRPLMASALLDWRDSAVLEETRSNDCLQLAFVMRDQIGSIISHCAYLIGGYEHMTAVSVSVREHIHEDSYQQYVDELNQHQEVSV